MTYKLHLGDCLDVLRTLPANSVDTVITDPPYGLNFMGKDWDHGVPGVPFWREVLRVAKPGAMLLAFGGTRTFHRLTCAIEDAGWEVRDCLMWLYGSGFPKSLAIDKAIDKAAGAEREVIGVDCRPIGGGTHNGGKGQWAGDGNITAPATPAAQAWHGWGTALKPAWEPIILAMKPCDGTFAQNALAWGVAGLNVDGGRIGTNGGTHKHDAPKHNSNGIYGNGLNGGGGKGREIPAGRWPANVLLDEESAAALDAQSGVLKPGGSRANTQRGQVFYHGGAHTQYDNGGGASRFFYVAKASRAERNAGLDGLPAQQQRTTYDKRVGDANGNDSGYSRPNAHPTVKPLALMRYLCKLTATPTGGVVLDPFMGSGTTGVACRMEGRNFIGVELDPQYYAIAERRIANARPPLLLPDVPAAPEPEQAAMFGD